MSENIQAAPNVPPFVTFVTSAVPMVFDNSMSYYEALCALWKWMQDNVVNVINNNAAVTEQYIQLTDEMKEYMDNYFDNLDVQQEINNKLDEMVADGTFESIVGVYLREQLDILNDKIDQEVSDLEDQLSTDITAEANARTTADTNLQSQINALGSGAPIPVANTSAMTDHSKVYVNTTDGKWYYWNGSAWTAGGTYQSSGIASGSVKVSSLENKLLGSLFIKSSDVSALGKINFSASNIENATTQLYVLSGTTITFSNEFVSNYQWKIYRCSYPDGVENGTVKAYSTDTSFQFTNDEYCLIAWKPIDDNWATTDYTVDRKHKLDSNDITSLTYYYPKYNDIVTGIADCEYAQFACSCRTFDSYGNIYLYTYNRWGTNVAIKSTSKVKVSMNDSRFNYAILKVAVSEDTSNFRYYEVLNDSGWLSAGETVIPANTMFIVNMRTPSNSNLNTMIPELRKALSITPFASMSYIDSTVNQIPTLIPDYDKYVKGINHRGFNSVAPENTIPAFKLSAEEGFKYVESDLRFTSDSVPVMIHDDTIDRTSDGTGNVADLTYSQISQYDFGSWKSADYTGTTIPTLYEFLECCRACGLTAYIELKTTLTDAQCTLIENALKQYGMMDKVTFISFNINSLRSIHTKMSSARLGFLYNDEITDAIIAVVDSIRDDNEVFMDMYSGNLTSDDINKCISNDYPLEVWTVDTEADILALSDYVTGVTSNLLIAGKVLLDNALSD